MFPSHSTKIVGVEHEYLAFGRKISPWTCTINDSPLHSSRVSSQPFLLFPSGGEEGRRFSPRGFLSRAGKTVRKWILEEKRMVDECKTRCRKGTRSNETPRERFRKRFCSILSYLLRELNDFRCPSIPSCDLVATMYVLSLVKWTNWGYQILRFFFSGEREEFLRFLIIIFIIEHGFS